MKKRNRKSESARPKAQRRGRVDPETFEPFLDKLRETLGQMGVSLLFCLFGLPGKNDGFGVFANS